MINNVLSTDGFYFCTDFDLTHTLQRLANTSPDFQEMSLLERVSCMVGTMLLGVIPYGVVLIYSIQINTMLLFK